MGGASLPDLALPFQCEGNLDSGGHPRLFEGGGHSGGPCSGGRCIGGLGSVQPGQWILADVTGSSLRSSSSLRGISVEAPSRPIRASGKQAHRRALVGGSPVEAEGSRQLPGDQEAADPSARKRRRPRGRRGGATTAEEEGRWERKGRKGQSSRRGGPSELKELDGQGPEKGSSAPGSGASTVHGFEIWDRLWSSLRSTRSRLRFTWIAARSNPASKKAAPGQVWPMPLPFPEAHSSKVSPRGPSSLEKLGVNYVVLCLNFLFGQGRFWKNTCPGLGTALNAKQWELAERIRKQVVIWNQEPPISAEEMGRSAAKVQSTEELIASLHEELLLQDKMGGNGKAVQERWLGSVIMSLLILLSLLKLTG